MTIELGNHWKPSRLFFAPLSIYSYILYVAVQLVSISCIITLGGHIAKLTKRHHWQLIGWFGWH